MTDIRTFEQIRPDDRDAVGGKGLSLGLLAAAGFPVPPGFCVTTSAYRRLRNQSPFADQDLCSQIAEAYHCLGGGLVAVRSSATAEDGTDTSYAGQQETILGADSEAAILDAVAHCWASLDSERAVAYRRRQGVDDQSLAMAVVVQRLVSSEVSGVLFTRDPLDPDGRRMLVEASWGLGESVVSGCVNPDRFSLDRQTGAVLDRHIGTKTTLLTAKGRQDVAPQKQNQSCLDERQLAELAELGRRVEAFYGAARDVEWAWAEGSFWLLQARPITTAGAAEREQVRREEIAALHAKADPRGTVWSRYNLSESLPAPTPLTWAFVRRFLSGKGGLGLMYGDLGFQPEPALDEESVYDLVCGRPYCNLSREPGMYRQGLPLAHSFSALKSDPQKALNPEAQLNWSLAGYRFWLFLPFYFCQSIRVALRLENAQKHFARRFREQIVPAFVNKVARGADEDLSGMPSAALLKRLEDWIQLTLVEFARDSLKPTLLAAHLMAKLEQLLAKPLGPARGEAALRELSMGARPDIDGDLPQAIHDLAAGRMDRSTFLKRFGHRGGYEMELSSPRWAEEPAALDRLIRARHAEEKTNSLDLSAVCARIANEAKWTNRRRNKLVDGLKKRVEALHILLGLRETAKHHWMQGYSLIRRILVELDRRYYLGGGIFYLVPEELPALVAGEDLSKRISERRRRRILALSLEAPLALFSDDLEAIGRSVVLTGADTLQGVPLSVGVAEGPALVLHEPDNVQLPTEPYILVCPSTDPAWVPLFVHAQGLVMETGGVLSHGAIVAREFGLPAVAGLPDIHRRLRTGQRLRVDGANGTVTVIESAAQRRTRP
jgi:phosphohistidine swiveling domain-containing protein